VAKTIDPPITGYWNSREYPPVVRLNGRVFRKAFFEQAYDGVVAQYREDVEQNSRHLKVMADGTWRIDHVDDDNPDRGRPIQHFFSDHPLAGLVGLALAIGAVVVVGRAIARG
jgi:hypothetical protein